MADKRATDNLGDIIGAIIGLPITLFILVIWSPFLLLAAILNVLSCKVVKTDYYAASQANVGAATKKAEKPLSKGGFLLVAVGLFTVFVFLLNFMSADSSGGATRSGGEYSRPVYSTPGGGSVWVNGYYHQDGTYVSGHFRSRPDGNPSNNWSTLGNVNPYTGEPGSKICTPHLPPPVQSHAPAAAGRIIPPQTRSVDTSANLTIDEQSRIRWASKLKDLGVEVDWRQCSLTSLMEMESRVRWANNLRRLGVEVDWHQYTLSTLMDLESRIRWANNLKTLGVEVDWQKYSLSTLMNMESRVRWSNNLRKLGMAVDWREHSLSSLMAMERQTRMERKR